MESVASAHNLAQALLNVSRNKGAPGVDDQTVEEVVEQAPSLLPKLQTARGVLEYVVRYPVDSIL